MISSPDVAFRRLDDEVVLVNLKTNRIFSLNRTGARFWELLADGGDRETVRSVLLAEFDVDEAELDSELDALIAALADEGFVLGEVPSVRRSRRVRDRVRGRR